MSNPYMNFLFLTNRYLILNSRKRGNADGTDHFDKIEEQEMKPKLRDAPPRVSHYSNETTDGEF